MTAPLQIFEFRRAVEPNDIFGGHVNFARYYKFAGEAFQAWYREIAISFEQDAPILPLMAHGELDFLDEMRFPATVVCRLTVVRVGRTSLEHRVEIFDAARMDGPCARGKFVNVCRSRQTHQSTSWPAEYLGRCWNADGTAQGV